MQRRKLFWLILLSLLSLFLGLFIGISFSQAAVTLMYFRAVLEGDRMKFTWETATEPGNVGFYIERSENGVEDYEQIMVLGTDISVDDCDSTGGTMSTEGCLTNFIFAQGNSVSGHLYQNIYDTNIESGKIYYYRLVAIDQSNNEERYTPQPNVTATNNATPTKTIAAGSNTATPTRTPTKTRTSRTANSSGIQASKTNTSLPAQPLRTSTPTQINVNATVTPGEPVVENTPTPTEFEIPTVPLPSITIIFPDSPTPTIEATLAPAAGSVPDNAGWFTPQRIAVLGIIAFIWIVLGGWFFMTIRKIQ